MNTFVQKTTALSIATLITFSIFSFVNVSPATAAQLKTQQTTSSAQKITITAKRMTAEEKLQFDLAKSA